MTEDNKLQSLQMKDEAATLLELVIGDVRR